MTWLIARVVGSTLLLLSASLVGAAGAGSSSPALLYASGPFCSCVNVYDQATGALVRTINGMSEPQGLATDSAGNLYVANWAAHTILVFAPGAMMPFKTLSDPGLFPVTVAVGDDGTVYVSNFESMSGPPGNLTVYKHGSTVPTYTLSDPIAEYGRGVAVDKNNNLYWSFNSTHGYGAVDEFVRGSGAPVSTGLMLQSPSGLAFGGGDDLIVSDYQARAVERFELPNTPVGQFGQTQAPYSVALNRFAHIYVADPTAVAIYEYTYPGGILVRTITAGWSSSSPPYDVATFPRPPGTY